MPASPYSVSSLESTDGRLPYMLDTINASTCAIKGLLATDISSLATVYAIVTPMTRCTARLLHLVAELEHNINNGDRTQDTVEYSWLANFCGMLSISLPVNYVVSEGR
ncbi:hypothetical protein HD806DRAFT_527820 [Xylariaceae sp. AK1471]|nr:hypothetical protein HD806DRAFT_527820 [Xylariaceae sp. AK1471]